MPNFITKGIGTLSFSLLSLCAVSSLEAQEVAVNSTIQTELTTTPSVILINTPQQQKYTVKGTVLDEDNLPLPGVSIVLKGTKEGVSTDFNGKFEFPKTLEANEVLVFNYIGYETKQYKVISSPSDSQDITILFNSSDIELMGEVAVQGPYKTKRNIFQKIGGIFK